MAVSLLGGFNLITPRRIPLVFCVLFALAGAEHAIAAQPNGYPISNVNLRAGPGTDFPVILTVQARAPIAILSCLGDSHLVRRDLRVQSRLDEIHLSRRLVPRLLLPSS